MTGVLLGIVTGIVSDVLTKPYVEEVHAETVKEEPKEVKIELTYTRERIIELIKETFPEAPNTAVAIAKCESGLVPDQVGKTTPDYGVMQINAPSWDKKAHKLGYKNYRKDVRENLKMARYVYDGSGNFTPWVCYNTGAYKKFL